MKKKIIGIVAAAALVVVAALVFSSKGSEKQDVNKDQVSSPAERVMEKGTLESEIPSKTDLVAGDNVQAAPAATQVDAGQFSDEGDMAGDSEMVVEEVSYDGKSFSPANLTINVGDIVIFRNKSDKPFWPASNPHPKHTIYPEFDAKKSVPAGQTFEFKFTKKGTWGFHDHLNAAATGSIVVQ